MDLVQSHICTQICFLFQVCSPCVKKSCFRFGTGRHDFWCHTQTCLLVPRRGKVYLGHERTWPVVSQTNMSYTRTCCLMPPEDMSSCGAAGGVVALRNQTLPLAPHEATTCAARRHLKSENTSFTPCLSGPVCRDM